jgi:hypothetical protein
MHNQASPLLKEKEDGFMPCAEAIFTETNNDKKRKIRGGTLYFLILKILRPVILFILQTFLFRPVIFQGAPMDRSNN